MNFINALRIYLDYETTTVYTATAAGDHMTFQNLKRTKHPEQY